MEWKNPITGKTDRLESAGCWTLFFGPFYFAKWDLWRCAGFVALLGLVTGGLSWFIVPFMAKKLAGWEYDRRGWKRVDGPTLEA